MGVLKSGVNVTLAGIVAVFFVLLKANRARCYDRSSTTRTSRRLFRSVGIRPREYRYSAKRRPAIADFRSMSLGIIPGLFAGKRIGVFGFCFLAVKFKLAKLPKYCNLAQFYGLCLLVPSLR